MAVGEWRRVVVLSGQGHFCLLKLRSRLGRRLQDGLEVVDMALPGVEP
jgi:hypothetical protein